MKCKERTLYHSHIPQLRSQRTEPPIPNPLHCVEYCVDAALFWLPTQILICKILIKSEIKGWEQSNKASTCQGQRSLPWSLAVERWPIPSRFVVLLQHHTDQELLRNSPPAFLRPAHRAAQAHIQGEGMLLLFKPEVAGTIYRQP